MWRRQLLHIAALPLADASCAAVPLPKVRLVTPYGPILVEIETLRAPISAGAFLACVNSGGYTGGSFTRTVRPDNDHGHPTVSVVQGAAKADTAAPPIAHESTRQTGLKHLDGTISLPRGAAGTATGAEFFICIGDQPAHDYGALRNPDGQGFAAFGRVSAGMNIVRRIWHLTATAPSLDPYTAGQLLDPPVPIFFTQVLGPSG